MKQKRCKHCGVGFYEVRSWQKFCCQECRMSYYWTKQVKGRGKPTLNAKKGV